jgi:hypothetical protein
MTQFYPAIDGLGLSAVLVSQKRYFRLVELAILEQFESQYFVAAVVQNNQLKVLKILT